MAKDLVIDALKKMKTSLHELIELEFADDEIKIFDFSSANEDLGSIIDESAAVKDEFVKIQMAEANAKVGIGKYAEDRTIYKWSKLFTANGIERTVHLGMDIFVPKNTPVLALQDCEVHSFANNQTPGDYGPTLVLEHKIGDTKFYTLYGHLSALSLDGKYPTMEVKKGECIGFVGNTDENGRWPEHLHFQIIRDMQDKQGDFPGVCAKADLEKYEEMCPDPNLILNVNGV